MCRISFVFFVGYLILLVSAHEGTEGHDDMSRVDAFLEILEMEKVSDTTIMPVDVLEDFVGELSHHFKCDGPGNNSQQAAGECLHSFCVNSSDLLRLVGGNLSVGVTEDQFENISIVLLHVITRIKTVCGSNVDLSTLTLEKATDDVLLLIMGSPSGHGHLHESDVSHLLNSFKDHLSHEEHVHDDHDHGDHHHDDHDHGDHHHDDHHQDGNQSEAHNHSVHAPEENHEGHNHENDNQKLILKDMCLSGDALFYFMRLDHSVDLDKIGRLATLIVFFVYKGYDVQDKCRIVPNKNEFIKNLFLTFSTQGKNMSVDGLFNLMTELGINPETEPHDGHHGDNHVHSHSKRSLEDVGASRGIQLLSRDRRDVANQPSVKQCYTAKQILAIYDSENTFGQALFQEMCPSLVSQKLFADCSHKEMTMKQQATEAEKYGYSTIATAIICLCSVFGVVFIPCVSKTVYDRLMSFFVGLAVGTLFSDAILHLIPSALGVHTHGDADHGHDHSHEGIVVETYICFGLAIMAGLYFFYIVETIMSRLGGHSHSHDRKSSDATTCLETDSHLMTTTFEDERKLPTEKSGKSYVVHADSPGMLSDQKPNSKSCGLTPVALMIIVGDSIHNFADGLAIGASFTNGIATGIATSIAVFCHELPHELGDFAVLLQSGLSFKKAVFFNLASALTAFAGLYVSLSVTTGEEAQRWIFAVTTGMFLYIALVDLLPQLIKTPGGLNFLLNNLGILLGAAIMLVIAIFEEHIII